MARPTTKKELIDLANSNFEKLWQLIDSMPSKALEVEFNFSDNSSKKEAHWNRDKNLRDVLVHLYEWHQLLLNFVKSSISGEKVKFLPEPYNWKNTVDLNINLKEKHQTTSLETAEELLKESHKDVLNLLSSFSNEELFQKKFFDWTGTTSLGSYCISATSSHYDWALKKLRTHKKKFKK